MHYRRFVLSFGLFWMLAAGSGGFNPTPAAAQERSDIFCAQGLVIISEIMAAPNDAPGSSSLRDQFGRFSDWIELHNTGDTPVNLAGWRLTDSYRNRDRWQFPDGVTIPGRGYLVVFASGDDRTNPAQPLHTNFRLTREGEFLGVVDPNGEIVFSVGAAYPEQFTGVAYGYEPRPTCLTGYGLTARHLIPATPGRRNPTDQGPVISEVGHEPAAPAPGQDLTVAATVAAETPVQAVTLHYRVNFGAEETVPMQAQAGLTYAATIPGSAAPAGALLRYYVTATLTGSGGQTQTSRWPLPCVRPVAGTTVAPAPPPARPHTVWLPIMTMPATLHRDYVRCPEALGTVAGAAAVESQTALPVMHWYIEEFPPYGWEWYRAGYNGHVLAGNPPWSYIDPGVPAVLYYNGQLFDNVIVELRGSGTLGFNKKGIQFELNEDYNLHLSIPGQPDYVTGEIDLATTGNDESYIRQVVGYAAYARAGVTSGTSFPVRIQQNGTFFSVATLVEEVNHRYATRRGLSENSLMYNAGQNTLSVPHYIPGFSLTAGFDQVLPRRANYTVTLDALIRAINPAPDEAPDLDQTAAYLFDHFDVPGLLNYLAVRTVLDDFDTIRHNYLLHQDLQYDAAQPDPTQWRGAGAWTILPWDKDNLFRAGTTDDHPFFGAAGYTSNPNALFTAVFYHPALRAMYLQRLRSVMDLLLGAESGAAWIDAYVAELTGKVTPDARMDSQRWSEQPLASTDIRVAPFDPRVLVEEIASRRRTLYNRDGRGYGALIPPAQAAAGALIFGATVAGSTPETAALTLVNCTDAALDISGWTLAVASGEDAAAPYTLRGGVVLPPQGQLYLTADGRAFRDEQRQQQGVATLGYFVQSGLAPEWLTGAAAVTLYDAAGRAAATTTDDARCRQLYLPVVQE